MSGRGDVIGVFAVCIHNGSVLAAAADFDPSYSACSSLRRAQELRARERLDRAVIKAIVGEKFGDAVCRREFLPQKLVGALVENADFRIEVIAIGHDGDAA